MIVEIRFYHHATRAELAGDSLLLAENVSGVRVEREAFAYEVDGKTVRHPLHTVRGWRFVDEDGKRGPLQFVGGGTSDGPLFPAA